MKRASTTNFDDVRKIVGIRDGTEIGISGAHRSDGERRHALAVEDIGDGKAGDAGLDFLFGLRVLPVFVFAVEVETREESSRGDGRDSGDPEEDFAKLFVIDREHKNGGRENGGEYAGSESHGGSPFPDYSGLSEGEGGKAIIAARKRKRGQNLSVVSR